MSQLCAISKRAASAVDASSAAVASGRSIPNAPLCTLRSRADRCPQICYCIPARPALVRLDSVKVARAWDGLTTFQATVQLMCLQVVAGYGGTPLVSGWLAEGGLPTSLSQAAAAVISQSVLLACVVFLTNRTRRSNGAKDPSHYTLTGAAAATAFACAATAIASSLLLKAMEASPEQARTAVEMSQVLASTDWAAAVGTGVATAILAPVVEEKIYRGFILPALIAPFNIHIAALRRCLSPSGTVPPRDTVPPFFFFFVSPSEVGASAALFAGSHLSLEAFPTLYALGTLLGYSYAVTGCNLLVPTAAHALYNGTIFLVLVYESGL